MKKRWLLIVMVAIVFCGICIFCILILKHLESESDDMGSILEIQKISKKWNGREAEIYFYLLPVDKVHRRKFENMGFYVGETIKEMRLGISYGKQKNEEVTEIYSLFDILFYLHESGQLDVFQMVSFYYNSAGYDYSGGGHQSSSVIVEEFKNMLKENEEALSMLDRDEKVVKISEIWMAHRTYRKYIRGKGFLDPLTGKIETDEPEGFLWREWIELDFDSETIPNPLQ